MRMSDFPSRLNVARQLSNKRPLSGSDITLPKIFTRSLSERNAMRTTPFWPGIATQILYARMLATLLRFCWPNLKR